MQTWRGQWSIGGEGVHSPCCLLLLESSRPCARWPLDLCPGAAPQQNRSAELACCTGARGAAGQHSPSTPAHAKHTTLVKVPALFQASNAQQRRGALTIRCTVEPRGGMRWRTTSETDTPKRAAPIETGASKRIVCWRAADIPKATFRRPSGALSYFRGRWEVASWHGHGR